MVFISGAEATLLDSSIAGQETQVPGAFAYPSSWQELCEPALSTWFRKAAIPVADVSNGR